MADIFGLLFPDARAGQLKNEETRNRILDNNRTRENVSGLQALLMGNAQTEATGNSPGNYVGPQSIDPNSLEGQQQMMGLLAGLPGGASAIAQGLLAPPGQQGRAAGELAQMDALGFPRTQEGYAAFKASGKTPEGASSLDQARLNQILLQTSAQLEEMDATRQAKGDKTFAKKQRVVSGVRDLTEIASLAKEINASAELIGLPWSAFAEEASKANVVWEKFTGGDVKAAQLLAAKVNRFKQKTTNLQLDRQEGFSNPTNATFKVIGDSKITLGTPLWSINQFVADGLEAYGVESERGGFGTHKVEGFQDSIRALRSGGNNAASRANIGGFPQVPLGK